MELTGRVVSTKMQKTAVVEVEHLVPHPLYKKIMRRRKKFKAHDPFGVKVGDVVRLESTKPLSRDKHFLIKEIVKK